jgi:hypothetical protein
LTQIGGSAVVLQCHCASWWNIDLEYQVLFLSFPTIQLDTCSIKVCLSLETPEGVKNERINTSKQRNASVLENSSVLNLPELQFFKNNFLSKFLERYLGDGLLN